MLGTPGMVALDLDANLKGLFQKIIQHLESIPKPQGENISAITCNLSVRNLCRHVFLFPLVNARNLVQRLGAMLSITMNDWEMNS